MEPSDAAPFPDPPPEPRDDEPSGEQSSVDELTESSEPCAGYAPPARRRGRPLGVQLIIMVAALVAVLFLMKEARKPERWYWMWGNQPPAETDDPDEPSVAIVRLDASAADGGVAAPNPHAPQPDATAGDAGDRMATELSAARERAWKTVLAQLTDDELRDLLVLSQAARANRPLPDDALPRVRAAVTAAEARWDDFLNETNDALLLAGDELPREDRARGIEILRLLELSWRQSIRPALRSPWEGRPWNAEAVRQLASMAANSTLAVAVEPAAPIRAANYDVARQPRFAAVVTVTTVLALVLAAWGAYRSLA